MYDLIEYNIPMKLLRLNKMSLKQMYISVCTGEPLSHAFHMQNGVKQGDALFALLFQICSRIYN